MTHMCLDVQTGVVVECISQLEVNACCGHSSGEEEESRNTHAPDREAVHQSPLVPDTRQRPDKEGEPCEYSGQDKCCPEPTGIIVDCRYCVHFGLDEDDCVRREKFSRHDSDRIEIVTVGLRATIRWHRCPI